MNIAIAGYNGFLGSIISDYLSKDYNIVPIESDVIKNYRFKELVEILSDCDIVINFCGFSIFSVWNQANQRKILESRYYSTLLLFKAIESINKSFVSFINASAVGIYGSNGMHSETSSNYSDSFLNDIIKKWESTFFYVPRNIKHHYIVRMGNVLDTSGGILKRLLVSRKFMLQFVPGKGDQSFSFIHVNDFRRAIKYLVKYFPSNGIYNFVTEKSTSFNELTNCILANSSFRFKIHVPYFLLKVFFGNRSCLLTEGQEVIPEKLLEEEFVFIYPDISSAIINLLGK